MNREGFAFSSLFCFFARALLLLNGYEIGNLAFVPRHVNLITLALFSCWLSPLPSLSNRDEPLVVGFKYKKSLSRLTDRVRSLFSLSL
jgi:hypothetical protein